MLLAAAPEEAVLPAAAARPAVVAGHPAGAVGLPPEVLVQPPAEAVGLPPAVLAHQAEVVGLPPRGLEPEALAHQAEAAGLRLVAVPAHRLDPEALERRAEVVGLPQAPARRRHLGFASRYRSGEDVPLETRRRNHPKYVLLRRRP